MRYAANLWYENCSCDDCLETDRASPLPSLFIVSLAISFLQGLEMWRTISDGPEHEQFDKAVGIAESLMPQFVRHTCMISQRGISAIL